jgi:hypothetical protein
MAMLKCLVAGMFPAIFSAQVLRIGPTQTDRTATGSFSVILESLQSKPPVGLQWELSVPPALEIAERDIGIGSSSEKAKKALTCRINTVAEKSKRYACILAGGQDPIPDGPVLVVHYRPQADVQGAPIRVSMEKIVGVTADLKRISIPNAEAIIRIR